MTNIIKLLPSSTPTMCGSHGRNIKHDEKIKKKYGFYIRFYY